MTDDELLKIGKEYRRAHSNLPEPAARAYLEGLVGRPPTDVRRDIAFAGRFRGDGCLATLVALPAFLAGELLAKALHRRRVNRVMRRLYTRSPG